nr:hypothetical protein [Oenococcus oeni]
MLHELEEIAFMPGWVAKVKANKNNWLTEMIPEISAKKLHFNGLGRIYFVTNNYVALLSSWLITYIFYFILDKQSFLRVIFPDCF